jgi:hypothetical protein
VKDKTKKALKSLLADVAEHEMEDRGSHVLVNIGDLKTLTRWAQNKDHIWFLGDRVKLTGVRVPFRWLEGDALGTVVGESHEDGCAYVRWDSAPDGEQRVRMFHNEIKRVK